MKKNIDEIKFKYSAICAGVAIQPIPFADIFILTPIQAYMGKEVANAYDIDLSEQESKEILTQLIGILGLGFAAQQTAIGLYKLGLPGFAGFTTIPLVFGITWGIGSIFDHYFKAKSEGRAISNDELRNIYKLAKKEAKKKSKDLNKSDLKKAGAEALVKYNINK
jgi:uncharacterized protein (DUF697 family)